MELNRYPDNFFAEVEQAAFSPPTSCPASAFRPTKCSRGGCSPYVTHNATGSHQLQPHSGQRAPMPVQSYHRDGKMRTDGNLGKNAHLQPNSAGLWDNQPDFAERLSRSKATRRTGTTASTTIMGTSRETCSGR